MGWDIVLGREEPREVRGISLSTNEKIGQKIMILHTFLYTQQTHHASTIPLYYSVGIMGW